MNDNLNLEESNFSLDNNQEENNGLVLPPHTNQLGMGRPSLYTPEMVTKFLTEIMTTSDSLRTICDRVGLGYSTLITWLATKKEFQIQYVRAKQLQLEGLGSELIELIDNEDVGDNMAAVQKLKLKVDTIKWLLSKLVPKMYGDKGAVDIEEQKEESVTKDEFSELLVLAKQRMQQQRNQENFKNAEDAEIVTDNT